MTNKTKLSLKILGVLITGLAIFAFASSATAGGLSKISVRTNPAGAKIYVGPAVVGVTPATISIPSSKKTIRIKLVKKGYKAKVTTLRPGQSRNVAVTLSK